MSDILEGLNSQQQQAVTYTGSPLLLLAGAGSGKTRVLTHRAAYFVDQKIAKPSQILLLTFTNKAAGEMKQRMSKLLPDTAGKSKLPVSAINLWAGTFHSFCCRVLRRDGRHIGVDPEFVIYDTSDQEDLIKSSLLDLNLSPKEFKPSSFCILLKLPKIILKLPPTRFQSPEVFGRSMPAGFIGFISKNLKNIRLWILMTFYSKLFVFLWNTPRF